MRRLLAVARPKRRRGVRRRRALARRVRQHARGRRRDLREGGGGMTGTITEAADRLGQPDAPALRRALVAAGFTPLPLFGKAPPAFGKNGAKKGLGGWQHLEGVTAEQIDGWIRDWPD